MRSPMSNHLFFFFNDTATTEIYTLSLHDALPIGNQVGHLSPQPEAAARPVRPRSPRSEEHTSELQSRLHLVCRLLPEKKKNNKNPQITSTNQHVYLCNTTKDCAH